MRGSKRTYAKQPITMPVLDPKAIGRRIRATRKARFWSIDDLCQKSGIKRGTLGAFESGCRIPCRDNLLRLSIALRRSPLWLLVGWAGRGWAWSRRGRCPPLTLPVGPRFTMFGLLPCEPGPPGLTPFPGGPAGGSDREVTV